MTAFGRDRLSVPLVAALLVLALLAGQAIADASVPSGGRTPAGQPVGRAGFAYLTGLRRFAAVLLFGRLEDQYHEYYGEVPADELAFLMPNFYIITWLDPEVEQAYYMATWILFKSDRPKDAFALAEQSVAANPRSGLLHSSYAQMLRIAGEDVPEQVRQADAAMSEDTLWNSSNEQWEAMTILGDVYQSAGLSAKAARAQAIADKIAEGLGNDVGFPESEFGELP